MTQLKYEVLVVDEKKSKVRSLAGLEAAFTRRWHGALRAAA